MRTQSAASLSRLEEGIPFARRHDPAVRERLSGPGLRTFSNVAREWGLTGEQQRALAQISAAITARADAPTP